MTGRAGRVLPLLGRAPVQWAVLALVLVLLGTATAVDFWLDFRYHRAQALERLVSQARLIEANVGHQLDAIDFALENLQAVFGRRGGTVPEPEVLSRHLDAVGASLQGVRTLSALDADGRVVASNRRELVGRNFRERAYFREPAAAPDASWLYVAPPFTTVLGVHSMAAVRALVAPDGRFSGIVVATLDPGFFGRLLASARYAEDIHVVVAHGKGGVFLAVPPEAAGWAHFIQAPEGIGEADQPRVLETDGAPRVMVAGATRTSNMVPGGELRVLVSRNLRAIEANGLHMGMMKLALFLCVALLSAAGLAYWQRWRRVSLIELRRQEQALRDSERFMRTVADHVPGMVGYWTRDLRCAFANQAYREWFGRRPKEMLGMSIRALLGEALFEKNRPYIEGALAGEPQRFERTLVKADGSTGYTWAQYIPDVQDGEVRGFLVLVSDITEVKQAQLALEQANAWLLEEMAARKTAQEELEQANAALRVRTAQAEEASAARSRFLASVSHELRTPLHTILGYVGLLRKDATGEAGQRLALVENSSAQLLKLIDELLEFSQGTEQAGMHPEPLALPAFLANLVETGRMLAAPQGNRFSAALADGLPAAVMADEQRLTQVLLNLIGNACKYTRDGEVRLRVEADGDCAGLLVGLCRLRFAVEDTGCGIASADLPHIFDAFARGAATGHQPGLGLGLAIARRWVQAMGGDIQVSSAPGQGSRFWFSVALPVAVAGGDGYAPCRAYAEALADAAGTVLVVDDITENRLILRDLCRRWGLAVVEAADGEGGLAACRALPAAAAVLVDQFMPEVDGWEFLRRLRQDDALRCLPVALVSASSAQRPAGFPEGLHFDLVLGKPFDHDVLGCFLCRRLARERPASCLWPVEPVAAAEPPVELAPLQLAEFQAMVERGRVEALADWAQALAAAEPGYGEFAQRVVGLCRTADLLALERLVQTARAKAS